MTHYQFTAKREVWYDVPVEANSEKEAYEILMDICDNQDIEEYAYWWSALDAKLDDKEKQ